jgi:hypothetical protein
LGRRPRLDTSGDVVVAQQASPPEILVFPPGQTQPSRTIPLPNFGQPFAIAISKSGRSLFTGDIRNHLVQAFAYPSEMFRYSITAGIQNPAGLAVSPAQF